MTPFSSKEVARLRGDATRGKPVSIPEYGLNPSPLCNRVIHGLYGSVFFFATDGEDVLLENQGETESCEHYTFNFDCQYLKVRHLHRLPILLSGPYLPSV